MRFNGVCNTYDGWNRLVAVAHAYRDGSNNVQAGQKNVTMSYDGRGRRITKAITNAGQWDCTYHYYYDNDSPIETRNGSKVRSVETGSLLTGPFFWVEVTDEVERGHGRPSHAVQINDWVGSGIRRLGAPWQRISAPASGAGEVHAAGSAPIH